MTDQKLPATDGPQPEDPVENTGAPDYEELLLRAGFNYHVFIAGAFGYAREQGTAPRQFIDWITDRLGQTWSGLRGHGADAVMNLILENLASTGYPVQQVEFDGELSRAEIGTIPLGMDGEQWREFLQPFAVTPNDMHELFQVFLPLAQTAGTVLELEGFRDRLRLTVRREVTPGAERPTDGLTD
jgi:hypothetical protein